MAFDADSVTRGRFASVAALMAWDASFGPQPQPPQVPRWAFRGQPREFRTLVPSIQRLFTADASAAAELAELTLINAFRDHYAGLPGRSSDMPEPALIGSGHDLRCLSVMQHYEVPTRLLDWTTSLWTAVYFACASDAEHDAEVWVYDRHLFSAQLHPQSEFGPFLSSGAGAPAEPAFLCRRLEQLLVETDPRLGPRMRQQSGHHTAASDLLADHAPLLQALADARAHARVDTPVDTQARRGGPVPSGVASCAVANGTQAPGTTDADMGWTLCRVVIDKACKPKALRFLADHKQITAGTIFPDVVGLGRFLRWQLDALRTMLL